MDFSSKQKAKNEVFFSLQGGFPPLSRSTYPIILTLSGQDAIETRSKHPAPMIGLDHWQPIAPAGFCVTLCRKNRNLQAYFGSLQGKKSPLRRFFGVLRTKRNKLLSRPQAAYTGFQKNPARPRDRVFQAGRKTTPPSPADDI
jgi:hypothetical protein